MNVENLVKVGDIVHVEDRVDVEDRVNMNFSYNSCALHLFVRKKFNNLEDIQAFCKAYAIRGFAMQTNHTYLSKDDKKLTRVDYVYSREKFWSVGCGAVIKKNKIDWM